MSDFVIKVLQQVRLWIRVFSACQVSKYILHNLSHFQRYLLQHVRLWIEGIITRETLNENFYNGSELEENFAFHKSTFDCFYSFKVTDLAFFKLFQKSTILNFKENTVLDFEWVFYNASVFASKNCNFSVFQGIMLQSDRFWFEYYTPFQILQENCLEQITSCCVLLR